MSDERSDEYHADPRIRELEADVARYKQQLENVSARNESIRSDLEAARSQLAELNNALAPRLLSILTLKPLRFVWNRRRLVKQGMLSNEGDGVFRPKFEETNPVSPSTQSGSSPRLNPRQQPVTALQPRSIYSDHTVSKSLGIAVYAFDRAESVGNVLESLHRQNALDKVHVWIDGDQGNPEKRAKLDETETCVSRYKVKRVHRNRGNFGFRKMMLISMRKMFEEYDRVLFLEDDCFPNRYAVQGFDFELNKIQNDPSIMSVYGHPFLTESEKAGPIGRFQGWGWASTRSKMMPLWSQLLETYLMSEEEYKSFVSEGLTAEMLARLDVTPGRQPSSTLPLFFAWDETLGYLAALNDMKHQRTTERLIYNFGVGSDSTHFNKIEHYRNAPFNMITIDEIWDHY